MRAGDVVKHRPSGETWVLAWGDKERNEVSACGWPESIAKMSDCDLIEAASDEEHLKMLKEWAEKPHFRDSGSEDYRAVVCKRQLRALS